MRILRFIGLAVDAIGLVGAPGYFRTYRGAIRVSWQASKFRVTP